MGEPRNAKDALIAEILGDVHKLQEAVDGLKGYLPAQTEAAELRLAGIIALLQKAGDSYQESLKGYTQSQGDTIRVQMEKDTHEARLRFRQDYDSLANEVLARIENTAKETLREELTVPAKQMLCALRQSLWKIAVLCLGSGLMAGMVVYGGMALTHDLRQEAEADLGRAVVASWGKLDKKARAVIDAERKM